MYSSRFRTYMYDPAKFKKAYPAMSPGPSTEILEMAGQIYPTNYLRTSWRGLT